MNTKNTTPSFKLLAVGIVAISFFVTSCTSLQQTTTVATDDLYYTPSKPAEQVVAQAEEETYQDYQNYQDDRYLRLKVANRNRWSSIDDWGYWNDPRFNNSFYPSYMGWNSWYSGYYGSSWYSPFGPSYMMGWGGYYPYSSFGYGFGFNDFAYGGFGGFGYGGFGYGGFGYGGFGYGGWNPYYAGMWNPYGNYYQYGGIYGGGYGGGIPMNVNNYDKRVPVQPNRANLNPYMKNIGQFRKVGDVRENGNYANSNSNGSIGARSNTPASFRSVNSNSASSNNAGAGFSRLNSSNNYSNSNATQPSASSFGSLVKRVMTSSSSARAASFNNSSRNYSAPNNSSNSYQNSTRSNSSPSYTAPASSGSSSTPSSGGGGFIGGGRTRTGGGK